MTPAERTSPLSVRLPPVWYDLADRGVCTSPVSAIDTQDNHCICHKNTKPVSGAEEEFEMYACCDRAGEEGLQYVGHG